MSPRRAEAISAGAVGRFTACSPLLEMPARERFLKRYVRLWRRRENTLMTAADELAHVEEKSRRAGNALA